MQHMPNTTYDGTVLWNGRICNQQPGNVTTSSPVGVLYRQLLRGQGVSLALHNQHKKTNDYHSCENYPVMFNDAYTFRNVIAI